MAYKKRSDLYAAQKRHRIKIRLKLLEFLLEKECRDCGEKDPVVLDFDHRDPKKKLKNVARMLSGHWSWESVYKEIEKCDIRCANCHRRKSYKQFGHWGKSKAPVV